VIDDDATAERLARAILDDITLSNEDRVRTSTDLPEDFAAEIEQGRTLFQSRVAPDHHHHYEDELLAWRGRAKDRATALGGSKLDRTRLLFVVGAVVAFVVVVTWLALR
jgi:hypothetical protein